MPQVKPPPPLRPKPDLRQVQSWGVTRRGNTTDYPVPAPPPMRIVRIGWWHLTRQERPLEVLDTED
jgi:hypothetical protein